MYRDFRSRLHFGAALIRHIDAPVVCHFVSAVRADARDVSQDGNTRREALFGSQPELKGRDVLVVDAVLESGVAQDSFCAAWAKSQPRSIRLVVLLDKPGKRRVALEPDYFGFRTASNQIRVGHGLAAPNWHGENHEQLSSGTNSPSRKSGKGRKKKA